MYRAQSLQFTLIIAIVALILCIPIANAAEETTSPKGVRAATKDDLEWMQASGVVNPTVGMSINPDDPNIGKTAGEVKVWLTQHTKLDKTRIYCLNSQFAQNLKSLMESAPGGPPQITGAYRTPQEQNALPSGSTQVAACGSYHNYGLAVDFNNSSGAVTRWLRENAASKGLAPVTNANPTTGCTARGFCDSGHIQMAGAKPPLNQCGQCSPQGASVAPGTSTASPSGSFVNSIRQALGLQQQPAPPPPPSQPLQQQQSPLGAFEEAKPIQLATTSLMGTTISSVADRLEELAFGSAATGTKAAISVPLIIDGRDVASITSTQQHGAIPDTQGTGGSVSQNTFVSSDLGSQAPYGGVQSQSAKLRILADLKTALLAMLQFLKPFRGAQEKIEHQNIYLE